MLDLTADSTVLASLGMNARVDVALVDRSGSTSTRGVSIASLIRGAVVYRFGAGTAQAPDTIRLVYSLPRVFGPTSPLGSARLTQHLSATQTLASWSAPWAPQSAMLASVSASATSCSIGAPGTACGIAVGIQPYARASVWGAFQSNPGTGQSYPISITFSAPVSSVTITAQDPTYAGNSMTAYTVSGAVVGTAAFAFSGRPGLNIPSTRTVRGSGIVRVQLSAPIGEYVAYDAIMFTPAGPPTLDVTCPSSATRGQTISCKVSLSDPMLAYNVTSVGAEVFADGKLTQLTLPAPGPIAAGQVYDLAGPAVTATTLTVQGTVQYQGSTLTLTNSASPAVIRVNPRPVELDDFLMTLPPVNIGQGTTDPDPNVNSGESALGLYTSGSPDWRKSTVATAASGPNAGLSYVLSVPGLPASPIAITLALYPNSRWFKAHPTTPGPRDAFGKTICTRAEVLQILANVKRHEGLTLASNSHYGIDQDFLFKWKLGGVLGGMVTAATGSPAAIKQTMALAMTTALQREWDAQSPLQLAFDRLDTGPVLLNYSCSIYPY